MGMSAEGGAHGPRRYVAVVGPARADAEDTEAAEEVGRLLARAGAVVVCGGLGGVMEAAARGCAAEGGVSVGLLPGVDRAAANPFLTVAVATGMGEARNALVVRAADAVIAIGGEFGTLSEIALALKAGTPVVGISTWTLARPADPSAPDPILRAGSAAEAVALALEAAGPRGS
jgi:uncharacterized protein (TIGR00725 family)